MSGYCENGEVPKKMKRADEQRPVTVVIGTQWGDEGKGKIVDMLAVDADLCCRCQGGNNAGHSVHVQDNHYAFHLIPSGVIYPSCKGVIGNGVVINLPELFKEVEKNAIENLEKRLIISDRAHLVFSLHQEVDGVLESQRGEKLIGTTKKGIGPTYSSKANRNGLRICDLIGDFSKFDEKFRHLVEHYKQMYPDLSVDIDSELQLYKELSERVKPMVEETVSYLHGAIIEGKRILVECAQSTILDIDFGLYPYVTSSNCSVGGVCTGLGIPPRVVGEVYGVVKAYLTRVGSGGFPTELTDVNGQLLQTRGREVGVTTGRPRRCGWLDLTMLKYSNMINGFTGLAVTKLDVLDEFDEIKIGVAYLLNGQKLNTFPASDDDLRKVKVEYEVLPGWKKSTECARKFADLPVNAQKYIRKIESFIGVPVRWVGVGRDRDSIISIP